MDNNNPYNYINPLDYYKRIEQENAMLKEQMRQQQFVDPLYAEFQQSTAYQEAKKNNVLTFLFLKFFGEWQQSEIGKQFVEWDKREFDNFRNQKGDKTNSSSNNYNGIL